MNLEQLTNLIPFLVTAKDKAPHFNFPRVFEAVLIAVITAYASQEVIKEKLVNLEWRLAKIEAGVEQTNTSVNVISQEQARRTPMIKYIEKSMSDKHGK